MVLGTTNQCGFYFRKITTFFEYLLDFIFIMLDLILSHVRNYWHDEKGIVRKKVSRNTQLKEIRTEAI